MFEHEMKLIVTMDTAAIGIIALTVWTFMGMVAISSIRKVANDTTEAVDKLRLTVSDVQTTLMNRDFTEKKDHSQAWKDKLNRKPYYNPMFSFI